MGSVKIRDVGWLAMISVVLVTALLPFSSFVAALSFIRDEWGLNNTQAGAVFSAYLAGYAVAALLVVPLTDRLPVVRVFVLSAITTVAASVLFELSKTLFAYYLTNLSTLDLVYGSVTTVVALMLFLYVVAMVLVLGAELSSEYNRLSRAGLIRFRGHMRPVRGGLAPPAWQPSLPTGR